MTTEMSPDAADMPPSIEQSGPDLFSSTASKATTVLGWLALAATAALLAFGLLISPPEVSQGESVRLFYIHVPSAIVCLYIAFSITFVGSIVYLRKQSVFWDLVAGASAEVGVVFLGFTLATGMLWGKPTWGTYWTWDPRLTSTAVSFVLYLGYLAVRRLDMDPVARSKRAAILGIVSFANLIIIRYSVAWWRSLHQGTTLDPRDTQLDDTMLTSFFLGLVALSLTFAWLVIHRFRVAWLEHQVEAQQLEVAIAERTASTDPSGLATGGA